MPRPVQQTPAHSVSDLHTVRTSRRFASQTDMKKLCVCALVIGLVYTHPAVELNRDRKHGSDSDKISFPEDISSPFVNKEEIVSDHYKNAVKALFEVVMRLKKVVTGLDGGGGSVNFVVSPLSVAVALGQVLLGARGETRRRLAEVLTPLAGTRLDEPLHREMGALLRMLQAAPHAEDFALDVAAAFFVQAGLPLRDSYRFSLNRLYGTDLLRLDFAKDPEGAQKRVNSWVSQHTRGHINNILPHPLPPTTAAVLANSIYFSGRWEQPFDPDLSTQALFHLSPKTTVPVTLMRNSIEAMYANSSTFSLVALPYRHQQAAMYLVLPHNKEKDIGEFMSELSLQELHRVINSVQLRVVNIAMPRMTLSMTFSLREPLSRLQNHKMHNEKLPNTTPADAVSPNDTEHEIACSSSNHKCEHLFQIKNVNKTVSIIQESAQESAKEFRKISKRDNNERLASFIGTGDQYRTSKDSYKVGTEMAEALIDLHRPYINSASDSNIDRKPANLLPKWTRVQNKTTTMKPSNAVPSTTIDTSSKGATTETPSSSSTQTPSKLLLDLTGASDDPRFRIDDIIHQSWLEVTETGTEAAAATVTTVDYSGDSVVFLVNRPFLFFIRHEVTLAPVFWGVIADPAVESSRFGSF